jgi:predicted transposase/invertase (TIGR01784 family)
MKLDPARSRFLIGFFEQYLVLNEREEELFRQEIGNLDQKEAAAIMELTNSWEKRARAEGIAQGKAEVARAALRKGISIDDVAEITGLPREAILELKRELEN